MTGYESKHLWKENRHFNLTDAGFGEVPLGNQRCTLNIRTYLTAYYDMHAGCNTSIPRPQHLKFTQSLSISLFTLYFPQYIFLESRYELCEAIKIAAST